MTIGGVEPVLKILELGESFSLKFFQKTIVIYNIQMILATHAIAGAALGKLSNNTGAAFFLGFLSHYVLDRIPHWQYDVKKYYLDENGHEAWTLDFDRAIILTGLDFAFGIIISILAFQGAAGFKNPSLPILSGAIGGVLPDLLQGVYFKTKWKILGILQKIHDSIHASWDFPSDSKLGIALQLGIVILIIFLGRLI